MPPKTIDLPFNQKFNKDFQPTIPNQRVVDVKVAMDDSLRENVSNGFGGLSRLPSKIPVNTAGLQEVAL
jgi:hypothetical protein